MNAKIILTSEVYANHIFNVTFFKQAITHTADATTCTLVFRELVRANDRTLKQLADVVGISDKAFKWCTRELEYAGLIEVEVEDSEPA